MKKWIGAFGIGAILLFMIGLSLYYLKYIQLLRFYWFRFPDVMLPFMGILLVALWINGYLEKSFAGKSVLTSFQRGLQTILRLTPVLALVALILFSVRQAGVVRASYQDSLDPHPAPIRAAMEWISKNTPQDAVFLVDPSEADFYLYAQRARLVSWKSAPQTAESVLEWYKRIKLCNGDKDPELKGFAAQAELQDHFYKLNAAEIRQITGAYKLDYMLELADADLPFERVYHDPNYAVYKLP
jgi:hypothetical protein